MKILIQKFGGTSVSTHERRSKVIDKIIKAKEDGYSPVVVVSAMGRKGAPYATDTLLSLVSEKLKGENLLATDLLMSCGEVISTVVMTDELLARGVEAVPMTGGQAGIFTDNKYSNAAIVDLNGENVLEFLKQGKVPIVAGFQGIDDKGFVTTLGRGGSDVTASLLGVSLKAEKIEIYTDVDGIMTADPRIVSDASLIEQISYNEVFEFADQGAKVIHPRAVEVAMKGNIPLVIKNTLSDCNGTIINDKSDKNIQDVITGITHMDNRIQIKVKLDENQGNDYYYDLLKILADNFISIDLINVFPKESIFTIDGCDFNKFKSVMDNLNIKYTHIDNCSKIAIIGSRIRGIPGIMAKILHCLSEKGIDILQTSDSHTTIWCLVESTSTKDAINELHKGFNLGNK